MTFRDAKDWGSTKEKKAEKLQKISN